jgi:hypothetical protein
MINTIFKDTFDFLSNSLNYLGQEKSAKDWAAKTPDAYKRLIDTIAFINSKKSVYNTDLKAIKSELVQMKLEAKKLVQQIPNASRFSLIFTIGNLIDSLIMEVDLEIKKREDIEAAKEIKNKYEKEKKAAESLNKPERVKVFKSAFSEDVEASMNKFLEENDIEITRTLQNIENSVVCITIFYK